MKDILIQLDSRIAHDPASDFGISVAKAFSAHAAGLAFAFQPITPGIVLGDLPADLFEKARAESEAAARRTIVRFEDAAQGAPVTFSSHVVNAPFTDAVAGAAAIARRFDLTVIRQEGPDDDGRQNAMIQSILFGSGRPLVVVPYIQKAPIKLDRIMVCWDNSQYSARAIADAIPLLTRAKKIEVVTVEGKNARTNDMPGADMGKHLARHGLNVSLERLVSPDVDAGDAILSHAADASIDFMVMGGYGHSRLREFVLGGVTRKILATMTLPVMMSH